MEQFGGTVGFFIAFGLCLYLLYFLVRTVIKKGYVEENTKEDYEKWLRKKFDESKE